MRYDHIEDYVRSEAYRTGRAGQKNPNTHVHMPRRLNELWFGNEVERAAKGWMDALRLAHWGLQGTAFQARMGTIRKAKSQAFPRLITFGHFEAEVALGLRGEEGIFGPPKGRPPHHIQELLDEHA
jgi:hypothetical protein